MPGRLPSLLLASLIVPLIGCTAPVYDDQTDKLVTQLQTDVETEITTLITLDEEIQDVSRNTDSVSKAELTKYKSAAGWNANTSAYDKIAVDLLLLRPRVEAVRNWGTPSVLKSIDLLRENLVGSTNSMRALHQRDGILRLDELQTINNTVGPELDALVAVEAQLKAGQSSVSTNK